MAPLTVALSVVMLLLQCHPTLQQQLHFTADSGWWSVVTSHFVHWSWDHLCWDLLVFTIVGSLLEQRIGSVRLCAFIVGATLAGTGALVLVEPELVPYRGLSGVAVAACTLAALLFIEGGARRAMLLALLFGKTAHDLISDSPLFVSDGLFSVAASVHGAGVAWGVLYYVVAASEIRFWLSSGALASRTASGGCRSGGFSLRGPDQGRLGCLVTPACDLTPCTDSTP